MALAKQCSYNGPWIEQILKDEKALAPSDEWQYKWLQ
jgi:hypothetical protein